MMREQVNMEVYDEALHFLNSGGGQVAIFDSCTRMGSASVTELTRHGRSLTLNSVRSCVKGPQPISITWPRSSGTRCQQWGTNAKALN